MKNIPVRFSLLLIFLSFVTITNGQLNFGLKGSVTMNSLSTDYEDIKASTKTGWQLGAFLRLGDKWHLQPEVYFGTRPGNLSYTAVNPTDPSISGTVSQDIKLTSVDVPLLIGYKIIDPPTMNIRLQAGPVASVVVDKTFTISGDGIDPPEISQAYQDEFRNLNWGLQFGAGVDFLFITADIRYELGLNEIINHTPDLGAYQPPGKMKSNMFILSVGFKII